MVTRGAGAGQAAGPHVGRYLDHLQVERGLSPHSLAAYRRDLVLYAAYLAELGVGDPAELETSDVAGFVGWLRDQRTERGRPYAASTITRTFVTVRGYHRFLVREGLVADDPAAGVRVPRSPRSLPKALGVADIERLLAAPLGDEPAAARDRAILETLYGGGLRITELITLDVDDVDLVDGTVRAWGKGAKERIVPVGRVAREAIDAWLVRGRPALAPEGPQLYCNQRGGRLTRQGAWKIVKAAAEDAGLSDAVSPHTLRHSFATHLVDNGADVRVVQELLGHASVNTTQVYTLVSRVRLRSVYDQAHPRAHADAPEAGAPDLRGPGLGSAAPERAAG